VVSKVLVCTITDVAAGAVKKVKLQDRTLAIYNIDGRFYATDDRCTHGLASLSDGLLDGDVIECAMHFGAFHVPSGKPVAMPCTVPLRTYDVNVEGSDIFVAVEPAAIGPGH
jgi:nitrite reductase/ring-hydroxylating ferredoxin subunit